MLFFADTVLMFNFWRNENELDTSWFDPEHDMDLVAMINEANTEYDIQSIARMGNARIRARRRQLAKERRLSQRKSTAGRGIAAPRALRRGH